MHRETHSHIGNQPNTIPDEICHGFPTLGLSSMYWAPHYFMPNTSAWVGHTPFAFWVTEAHRPKIFVELGTQYGHSYFAFCQAVHTLKLETKCFAIDTWEGDEHSGYYGEEVFSTVSDYNKSHYETSSTLIRSSFDAALREFDDGSIDLLHIDGHHSFASVKHDFETWLPKLSQRGLVLLHDTNVRIHNFGVELLLSNLRKSYKVFEFYHASGLGVVGTGPEQEQHLQALFECARNTEAGTIVRNAFARLGECCTVLEQLQSANNEVDTLQSREKELSADIYHLRSDNESLRHNLSHLQQHLFDIRSSTSWRLTRPLRATGDLLRALSLRSPRQSAALNPPRPAIPTLSSYLCEQFGGETKRRVSGLLELILQRGPQIAKRGRTRKTLLQLRSRLQRAVVNLATSAGCPEATIIVPVYKQHHLTLACVLSVLESEPQTHFEILIADDASPDPADDLFEHFAPAIRVLKAPINLGFLRNCNNAAREARGKYLIFLNNDTIVLPGWLDALVARCRAAKDKVISGSKLVNPDGTLQEAGAIVWSDGTGWNYGRNDDPAKVFYSKPRKVDYCSGASLCVPKAMWEELGGFDDDFAPAYCEEVDFCFRARNRGYETFYEPQSVLIHVEGASHGTDTSAGLKLHQTKNQSKLRERYRNILTESHFSPGHNIPLARHRQSSRRLLLLDHKMPEPERDAGSRSIWHIAQTLSSNGYVVYFWPADGLVSSKVEDRVHGSGLEVLCGPEFTPNTFGSWLTQNARHFDAFLLSRPMVAIDYIDLIAKASSSPILYYGHDIHHIRWRRTAAHQNHKEAAVSEATASSHQAAEQHIWDNATTIYYPSDVETRIVNRYLSSRGKPPVAHTIPLNAFETFGEPAESEHSTRDMLLFVGGFDHPPNEDAILWFVETAWPSVKSGLPRLRLCIVGSNPTTRILSTRAKDVTVLSNISDEALGEIYRRALLSIAPLRSGGGLKGKITEALRFGVPVVTTPIGAEGFHEADNYMCVASTAADMSSAIAALASDRARWLQMSRNASKYAREHFSVDAMWKALSAGLHSSPVKGI